jgi:hypothetical protein
MTQIQETIVNKISILPIIEQEKVLEFIEHRIKISTAAPRKSLGGMLNDCLANVPKEMLESLPSDLAENFDRKNASAWESWAKSHSQNAVISDDSREVIYEDE